MEGGGKCTHIQCMEGGGKCTHSGIKGEGKCTHSQNQRRR